MSFISQPNPNNPDSQASTIRWEVAAVVSVLVLWVFMLSAKIGAGLIAGLAVFSMTRFIRRGIFQLMQARAERLSNANLKVVLMWLPTVLTTLIVVAAIALIGVGFTLVMKFLIETLVEQGPRLVDEAIRSLSTIQSKLPEDLRSKIPGNADEFFAMMKTGSGDIVGYARNFGGASFFVFLQLVFACILGVSAGVMSGMVGPYRNSTVIVPGTTDPFGPTHKPLSSAWVAVLNQYVRCFTLLMGAQVYVSIWNTFCTAVFVYGILPAFGAVLPLRELLLIFTAVASLIPAAGNVMANTLIFLLTIRYGPFIAAGSVVYLFVIHKLEYFVNGYIIGRNVRASVPEMLIAIILGEVAFGLPGLITAPVTYAFLKLHWQKWGWV